MAEMVTYSIPGPDGKTYSIQGPPGKSRDEVIAAIQSRTPGSAPAPDKTDTSDRGWLEFVGNLGTSAFQGATFGFGDEIGAGVAAPVGAAMDYFMGDGSFDLGKNYDEALGRERKKLKDFRETDPIAAYGSEIVGGLLSAKPTGLLRMGAAKGGAAAGAGYGAGTAEGGPMERLKGALVGAPFGAVAGKGGELALRGAGSAVNAAYTRARSAMGGLQQQESLAARKIAEKMMEDNPGLTFDEAVAATKAKLAELGPDAVLADTGSNIRSLLGSMYRMGGEAKTVVDKTIKPRQEGAYNEAGDLVGGASNRVRGMLDRLVPENRQATAQTLSRPTEPATEFYQTAFRANQQMDSPALRRILTRPAVKDALEVAAELMQNQGKMVSKSEPELTALARELQSIGMMGDEASTGAGIGRGVKMETLDLIKKALDKIGKAGRRSDDPIANVRADNARDLARELRTEMDNLDVTRALPSGETVGALQQQRAQLEQLAREVADTDPATSRKLWNDIRAIDDQLGADDIGPGAYNQGRGLEQTRIRAREALEDAEGFLLRSNFKDTDELRAALAEMEPEQLHAFRVGVAGVLKRIAGDNPSTHDIARAGKMFDTPNLNEKIKLAFGDGDTYRQYIKGLLGQREKFKTYGEIYRGSQTAERLAADQASQVDPAAVAQGALTIARNPLNPLTYVEAGARIAGNAAKRFATPEPVRAQIARALTGNQMSPVMGRTMADAIESGQQNAEIRRALALALAARSGSAVPQY